MCSLKVHVEAQMKSNAVGLILPPWARFTPVSEEDFIASMYENIHYINELPSRYKAGMSYFDQAIWEGTKEQRLLLKEYYGFFGLLESFYLYAEKGISSSDYKYKFGEDDFVFAIEPLAILHSLKEWHGVGTWAAEKIVYKAFARIKLDTQIDLETIEKEFPTIGSGFLPMAHKQHLTLVEVALLAGVSTIRSIRNATYDKVSPLSTIKEGGNVLVTVDEAKHWLAKRPKFVPTQNIGEM